MYLCTNNPSLIIFALIFYTKSQQTVILPSKKSMDLSLLVDLYNTLKDTKNIMFNLTITLVQKENIDEYTC